MLSNYKKIFIVLILFSFCILLIQWITPKKVKLIADNITLENSIPKEFNSWRVVEANQLAIINVDDNSLVNKLYSQVLERTYINEKGNRVYLSIAYGAEQRRDMLAHFPEVCYPAQGFNIDKSKVSEIMLLGKQIKVKQLNTQRRDRFEDVSYFVRVGSKLVATRADQKWEAVKYGLQGVIPDGLIFRVSTIGENEGFKIHQNFMNQLFSNLDNKTIHFIIADYLLSEEK